LDDFPESLPELRERIQRNRGDADSLHTLGEVLAARGEYQRSFICHRAAAVCSPKSAKYLYYSGNAALAVGRVSDAAWYLDRALSIAPNYAQAWQKRGELYLEHLNEPDEAFRSFCRAIALAPEDPRNYQLAARCMLNDHTAGSAVISLREAMPPSLDSLNADRGVALALADVGYYEDAAPILHGILQQQPPIIRPCVFWRNCTQVCGIMAPPNSGLSGPSAPVTIPWPRWDTCCICRDWVISSWPASSTIPTCEVPRSTVS